MNHQSSSKSGSDPLLRMLHERPQMPVVDWLRAPAHVHYQAFRMADPPGQRAASRKEFQLLLETLEIPPEAVVLRETFGYGVKETSDGERLIVLWQAHTEYYKYQSWHLLPPDRNDVAFGPVTFPGYRFPDTLLGTAVCRLDMVLTPEAPPSRESLRALLPGPMLYGSRILNDHTSVFASFTPDDRGRERYWVTVASAQPNASHLKDVVDGIVRIETYYHLLLMQKPLFSAAIDQVYKFEQVHLKQREIITDHIGHADSRTLQRWLSSLTQDLLKTNRMAGKLHFELSAAAPYDKIVHATLASLMEKPIESYRPLSDYVLSGITGVAEGYQQLLKRIDTLRSGFEGIISIIRTRVDLLVEAQNLALLQSVDKTTKSQVLLQHTVEGLSVIVIAYYLSGLMSYVFKGLSEVGWLANSNLASAVFVPVAIVLAFIVTTISRKYLHKKLAGEQSERVSFPASTKQEETCGRESAEQKAEP